MSFVQARAVAKREIDVRTRTKAFKIVTAILVLAAIAGPVITAVWPEGDDGARTATVAYVGPDGDWFTGAVDGFEGDGLDIEVDLMPERTTAEAAVADQTVAAAVIAPGTMIWNEHVDGQLAGVLYNVLQFRGSLDRGTDLGLDSEQVTTLIRGVEVDNEIIDAPAESSEIQTVLAFLGMLTAFILPQVFGQLTMMSVIEEKASRVVEVLLSHISARTLLSGKIAGVVMLAIAQLCVVIGGLTAALLFTDLVDIPPAAWRFLPTLGIWTLAALVVYSAMFALLGSLISRQEDASQVMMPVMIPLVGGYMVAQTAVFGNAESLLVRILSFIPLTAPMLVPVRVARDAISPLEIVGASLAMFAGIALLLVMAARVYETTILHSGTRVGWKAVWRIVRGRPRLSS